MTEIIKETGFFESFDGTPVYYEVRGSGKPLFLLYGIACSSHHWRHQLSYFSKGYQTIVMDYRGHQKTPLPDNPESMTIEALARDAKSLLDHLGIKKASFWGHSFASQVILSAYRLFPESFNSIVFVNAFAANPLKKTFGYQYALKLLAAVQFGYQRLPSPLSRLWKMVVNHPLSLRASALAGGFNLQLSSYRDLEVYSRGVGAMPLGAFTQLFEQMISFDGRDILPLINVPTLVIGGSKDSITPVSLQEELADRIPNSELTIVPFGSHCTPLDMPDMVNLRIEKFLRSLT